MAIHLLDPGRLRRHRLARPAGLPADYRAGDRASTRPATHSDEHAARHGHNPAAVGSEFDGLDAHALAHLGGGGQGPTLREQVAALGRPAVWIALLTTLLGYGGVFISYVYIAPLLTDVAGFDRMWITPLLLLFGAGLYVGNHLGGKLADPAFLPAISAPWPPWRSPCSPWDRHSPAEPRQ